MFLKKILSRNFLLDNFYLRFDKKKYYRKENKLYFGSLKFWRILFLNLIFPGRFLIRFKYGQIFKNKKKILNKFNKVIEKKINSISEKHHFDERKISILKDGINTLNENGGLVINNYFSENDIDDFVNTNKDLISKLKFKEDVGDEAKYKFEILKFNKMLKKFWYDPGLITLLESYFDKKIYARNYPHIKYTEVPSNYNSNKISKTAHDWHVDHALIAIVFVLLEDVEETGTRMQIVKSSHKYQNIGNFLFSPEVFENSKTINFFGKKGTIHIHLGNTVHRANLSSGKNRLNLYFEYTIGPNILFDVNNLVKSIDKQFDIEKEENLTKEERDFVKGIYPNKLSKGYEIIKNSLKPTRYRGI